MTSQDWSFMNVDVMLNVLFETIDLIHTVIMQVELLMKSAHRNIAGSLQTDKRGHPWAIPRNQATQLYLPQPDYYRHEEADYIQEQQRQV